MANDKDQFQVDIEETSGLNRTIQDTNEEKRRRVLGLPQQPSHIKSKKQNGNNSSDSQEKSKPNNRNNKKNDNQSRREERDNDAKRSKSHDKTSNNRNQSREADQRTNPNTLKNKIGQKGKEKIGDKAKQQARQQARNTAKKVANKGAKKGAKKAMKAGAKLAAKAVKQLAVKGIALITKALLALVSYIGLPAILIGAGIIILILILMTVSSMIFGTGTGSDELGPEAQELRAHIVEVSQNSVDSSKPEQQQYKVPEELLAAVVQLDSWLVNGDEGETDLEHYKDMVDEYAEQLKPDFTYETFNEWTKTSTKYCAEEETVENEDGTTSSSCVRYEWSDPVQSDNQVDKITNVEAWNGTGTFEYEAEDSEWVVEGDTKTQRRIYVIKSQDFNYDFSKLDAVLTDNGYTLQDKKMFEFFYEASTEIPMHYIEWLETGVVNFGGGGGFYFDGTITPGGGIPPQYMPHYLSAQEKYGIPWYILASIHFHETTFSTHPSMMSSVGAMGHMQFMPLTWVGWSYPGGTRLGNARIPDHIQTNPAKIKQYGGYGTDANGDGRADPWDVADAIHSAAKYLKASGYAKNPRQGIRAYNHSDAYVNDILTTGEKFKNAATYTPDGIVISDGDFTMPLPKGVVTSGYGPRWGKMHHGMDFDVTYANTAPVVAAAAGTVIRSQNGTTGYGNYVIVRHNINGKQVETLYAHLASRAVNVNQQVTKGQFLGMMGTTGDSTGPHLHFEVHDPVWNGSRSNSKNPAYYLNV